MKENIVFPSLDYGGSVFISLFKVCIGLATARYSHIRMSAAEHSLCLRADRTILTPVSVAHFLPGWPGSPACPRPHCLCLLLPACSLPSLSPTHGSGYFFHSSLAGSVWYTVFCFPSELGLLGLLCTILAHSICSSHEPDST